MAQTSSTLAQLMRDDIAAEYERMQRDLVRQLIPGYVPPKLTRWQRMRSRAHWKLRAARTAVAKRIAPWLDEDY